MQLKMFIPAVVKYRLLQNSNLILYCICLEYLCTINQKLLFTVKNMSIFGLYCHFKQLAPCQQMVAQGVSLTLLHLWWAYKSYVQSSLFTSITAISCYICAPILYQHTRSHNCTYNKRKHGNFCGSYSIRMYTYYWRPSTYILHSCRCFPLDFDFVPTLTTIGYIYHSLIIINGREVDISGAEITEIPNNVTSTMTRRDKLVKRVYDELAIDTSLTWHYLYQYSGVIN